MTHKPTVESAHSLQPWQRDWLAAFARYASRHPAERAVVSVFSDFAAAHADAAERRLAAGHLTGSAWLVDAGGMRVLLTHHRKLDRWLQLGGHADGDVDLARVALREAEEESGLRGLVVEPEIFDLDRHEIPARGHEPAHWHYDVRYVVCALGREDFIVGDESHALAWRDIAALADDEAADASLRRMARKWLEQP
ncbi:MAG: NUDIX hydrolase [Proteobacteria bacterium]|nr:NUDIX hydrolase [Pseudomonadota bacterium]